MLKTANLKTGLIKGILWGSIFYSALALLYHSRWFIFYCFTNNAYIVPHQQIPVVWFAVQICTNIVFLTVGYLLIKLFKTHQIAGFANSKSLIVFDGIIICCFGLAILGAVQTVSGNIGELHFSQWTSLSSSVNLFFRSFTRLIIFRNPQTMYFLLALILWVVKQFIVKALIVKNENEAFI